jgi:hypothetical protein
MPAQPVDRASSLDDEIMTVIEQKPDLHRPFIQERDRELADSVLDDRSGDCECVDLVRLPRLALPLARGAHPLRRDAHDPLTGGKQRLLEPAGDRAAVLDRPHPLLIQSPSPANRGQMPRPVRRDLPAAAQLAGAPIHCRQRMRALCVSAPITIIYTVPSLGLVYEADLRRTTVTQGESRASIKSRRRSSGGGGRHEL